MASFINSLTPRQKDAILSELLPTVDLDRASDMLTWIPISANHANIAPEVFGDSLVIFPVQTSKKPDSEAKSMEIHDPAGVVFGTQLPYYRITAGGYWASFPDTEDNFLTRVSISKANRQAVPKLTRQQQSIQTMIAELEDQGIDVPQEIVDRYVLPEEPEKQLPLPLFDPVEERYDGPRDVVVAEEPEPNPHGWNNHAEAAVGEVGPQGDKGLPGAGYVMDIGAGPPLAVKSIAVEEASAEDEAAYAQAKQRWVVEAIPAADIPAADDIADAAADVAKGLRASHDRLLVGSEDLGTSNTPEAAEGPENATGEAFTPITVSEVVSEAADKVNRIVDEAAEEADAALAEKRALEEARIEAGMSEWIASVVGEVDPLNDEDSDASEFALDPDYVEPEDEGEYAFEVAVVDYSVILEEDN